LNLSKLQFNIHAFKFETIVLLLVANLYSKISGGGNHYYFMSGINNPFTHSHHAIAMININESILFSMLSIAISI